MVRLGAIGVAMVLVATGCGGEGDEEAAAGPECEAVGADLAGSASTTVAVELKDYSISLDESEITSGVVTFATTNAGSEPHELAFLPGGGPVPLTAEGAPDEDALATAGAFELEAYGPGLDCPATYDLPAGTYTLFCIVESPDGRTHLEQGMQSRLVVR